MTVVYYTSTYFLDISLDIINELKKHVELHVFIEVTEASKKVNLVDIDELPQDRKLVIPAELLSEQNYKQLKPFLNDTASVHFVIHPHASGFSYSTLAASKAVWKYVKQLKPAIIHFEGYTLRTAGMLPYLFKVKKIFLSIHDPIPHTGEKSWKIRLPNLLFFYLPFKKYFIFYSKFSHDLFVKHYPTVKQEKIIIEMCAYSYYKRPVAPGNDGKHILFFGRISPYKGIDVLLKAMPLVFDEYPNQELIVAGKSANDIDLAATLPDGYKQNVKIINRHIPTDELIKLITDAKFVVCPYLDATQSGVLMTAFALDKPVVASYVGSFPEYINENVNGLLVQPRNPQLLAGAILTALNNDNYKRWADSLSALKQERTWSNSMSALLNAYKC
jgi:glycosyltransferase involved in cell wall biosynthesis